MVVLEETLTLSRRTARGDRNTLRAAALQTALNRMSDSPDFSLGMTMLGLNKLVLFFLCLILSASSVLADDSASYVVTRIRFFPRPGHAAEMVGGNFVGSITSATNDFNVMVR